MKNGANSDFSQFAHVRGTDILVCRAEIHLDIPEDRDSMSGPNVGTDAGAAGKNPGATETGYACGR